MLIKCLLYVFYLFIFNLSYASQLDSATSDLHNLVDQIKQVNNEIQTKKQQHLNLNKAIDNSVVAVDSANKLLKQLQQRHNTNSLQLQQVATSLQDVNNSIEQSKLLIQVAINKIYQQLLVVKNESSILRGSSSSDKQRQQVYLMQLLKLEQKKYQILKDKLIELQNVNNKLTLELQHIDGQLIKTSQNIDNLNKSQQNNQVKKSILEQEILSNESKLSILQKKQASLNNLVQRLLKDQEKKAQLKQNYTQTDSNSDIVNKTPTHKVIGLRTLVKPLSTSVIVEFGQVCDGMPSNGILYSASTNADIFAVAKGRVLYSGVLSGFGQIIIIDNGNDYNSIYSGIIPIVKKGDVVKAGQVIANSGTVDNQPMGGIYFELRHLGKPINPSSLFKD